jgi:hypothetical protein
MPDTRWLDREACAAYVSVRVDELPRLVKRGLLPAPSYHLGPRCPRWDRLALDARFSESAASQSHDLAVQEAVNAIVAKGRSAHAR